MNFDKLPELMSIKHVAETLDITHVMVRSAISRGELAAFKVGGRWRITRDAVKDWIALSTEKSPLVK